MKSILGLCMAVAVSVSFSSCGNADNSSENAASMGKADSIPASQIKEEKVNTNSNGVTMNNFLAYDASKTTPVPGILIVPEWWGISDFVKDKAKDLASLGYVAMVVDFYGNGTLVDSPDSAGYYAEPFYKNPQLGKARFDAALQALKNQPGVDTTQIAAIGYCFGGTQVLNMAAMGENLKGVVSFHGGLNIVPADKNTLKAAMLICHGSADSFVPDAEVNAFRKQMDAAEANYTFKVYEGATHAFTNPGADAKATKYKMPIRYDQFAASNAWKDMRTFFGKIFH